MELKHLFGIFLIFLLIFPEGQGYLGIFHKRRLLGTSCTCQERFADCAKTRGHSDKKCNYNIKRNYHCSMQFKTKGRKGIDVVDAKTGKSLCAKDTNGLTRTIG